MLVRLGNVLYWLGFALTPVPLLLFALIAWQDGVRDASSGLIAFAVALAFSAIIWLAGRAARYVLAGL